MLRVIRFVWGLLCLIFTGKFAEATFEISRRLPKGIFVFNRGFGLTAPIGDIDVGIDQFDAYRLIKADAKVVDAVAAVAQMNRERVSYLLNRPVVCYLAAPPEMDWSSVGWFAFGRCYVRGMGFTYDFGSDPYTFGLQTMARARHRGLNRLIISASLEEAGKRGSKAVYSMVEFTNSYALSFHLKMGYRIFLNISYMKIFGLRVNRVKSLDTNQARWRIFFSEPKDDVTII